MNIDDEDNLLLTGLIRKLPRYKNVDVNGISECFNNDESYEATDSQ